MKYIYSILLIVSTFLAVNSCYVHQFPKDGTPAQVDIQLYYDTDLPPFLTLDVDSMCTKSSSERDLRYILRFHRRLSDGTYARDAEYSYTFTKDDVTDLNHNVTMFVPEGDYRLLVWSDYVNQGSEEYLYYNTDNFTDIIMQTDPYTGNEDSKDAFTGSIDIQVVRYGSQEEPVKAVVNMRRPLAKFVFITTDLDDFITKMIELGQTDGNPMDQNIDIEAYDVIFFYKSFVPTEFNMFTDKPIDAKTGLRFHSKLERISDTEAEMGFDYILVNGTESSIIVAVGLFDKDGNQLSMTTDIEVPIVRSKLTTVRGSFLMQEAGGGVYVDSSYDGDINIIIP